MSSAGRIKKPLQSLKSLDAFDGESMSTEITLEKCKHQPVVISPTEVKCSRCGVGWMGKDVVRLVST